LNSKTSRHLDKSSEGWKETQSMLSDECYKVLLFKKWL
jgi:hypothetical protein